MRGPEPAGVVRPHPPRSNAPIKRFSVRDGFHLKDRNDEKRVEIDEAIAATGIVHAPVSSASANQTTDTAPGPSEALAPVNHRASCVDTEVSMIFDFLHRPAPAFAVNEAAPPKTPDAPDPNRPTTQPANDVNASATTLLPMANRQAEAAAILSRLGPSADWLIYRHRSNDTPRRKDEQLEHMVAAVLSAKDDELLAPTTTSSTDKKSRRSQRRQQHRTPTTTDWTAGKYTTSSASTGPTVPPAASGTPKAPSGSAPSAFSTQRSRLREKTAVPLKTEKLLGRMHELRSFPAVVERVLQHEREKRHEMVEHHGKNHVVKNKRLHRLMPPLQRPVHTPIFPSLVEHKQHQAWLRKQLVDENQELTLKSVVNRWQNRRLQIQAQERTHYVQSQWLLITHLAQATGKWMKQFRECRARRALIFRLAMIKKIQRYWKQRQFLRLNKQAVLAMPANSPLRSHFYRLPIVLHAIRVVQMGMRRWLARKRRRENAQAIEIIVTSWLEFQDVKFRRLILRFRKRVREFQTRWRTWRAITDARIKLLLLVWTQVERKHKRRGGIVTSIDEQSPSPQKNGQPRTTSSETIHRHLRNGGMILTAVSALGSAALADAKTSPTARTSPLKQEAALRQNVEDDLHVAMRDFYSTKNSSPTTTTRMSTSPVHHQSTSMLPRGSQSPSVSKTSSASAIQPWKNTTHHSDEKIPHSLKVSLLRQLLSEKRKAFQATKDRKRAEWKVKRRQMRQVDFRYNVLDELAAFQRFEAEHAVFLVLQSISENEMLHVIERAHQRLRVSTNPLGSLAPPATMEISSIAPGSPKKSLTPRAPSASRHSRYDSPRASNHARTSVE